MHDEPIWFRPHTGGLAEAMEQKREIKTRAELVSYIRAELAPYGIHPSDDEIVIEPYGYDARIGWDTYIVILKGYGVFGFTSGPLT